MTSTVTIQASEHQIKSVTVFKSSKAEVVRTFKLDLEEGQNKILIRGLPSTLETNSVRVSGLSTDASLFDVVATIKPSKSETYAENCPQEIVRTLRMALYDLESKKAIREMESQLLITYAQTLTGEHVDPEKMGEFLDVFLEREKERLEASLELKGEILELERQIAEEIEKTTSKRGTAHGRVDIVIVSDISNTIEFKLTYIVSNATWTPTYELHATTENGKPSSSVSLHYRACVTQSTGEDWNNTALTLSTVASDTVVRQIPRLQTVKLTQPSVFPVRQGQANVGQVMFMNNNVGPGQAKNGLFGSTANTTSSAFGQARSQVQPTNPFGSTVPTSSATTSRPQQTSTLFGAAPSSIFGSTVGSQAQSNFGSTSTLTQQPTPGFGTNTQVPKFGGFSGFGGFGSTFGGSSIEPPPASTDGTAANKNTEVDKVSTLHDTEDFEEIEGPSSLTDPTTIVFETPIAISFTVHGQSTIPSDGDNHQAAVAVLPFTAKISYVVIPRIDPRVFLQCEVKNTSEYRLLPGPVTVILDDSYVSKTSISDVNVSDTFTCTLGSDASSKVTYARTSKTVKSSGGSFSEVTNTTTYTSTISIHNKHQFPISDLIVRDIIPTCVDKRVKVVLRKPEGLADAKEGECVAVGKEGLKVGWEKVVDGKGGEKDGKFEWLWKIGIGEKVKLEAEWEVNAPGEIAWVETV